MAKPAVQFKPPPPPKPSTSTGTKPPPPPGKRGQSTGRRGHSVHSRKSAHGHSGNNRWLRRNWLLLVLISLAILGIVLSAILFLEPCKDTSIKTIETVLTPIDVVFLLDASGSMDNTNLGLNSPWYRQVEATSLLLSTLITASNHSLSNGTFQSSIVQWSGTTRETPTLDAIKVSSPLSNDNTAVLQMLTQPPLQQELKRGTFFAPALTECYNQLENGGQNNSYKLCVLITDGINYDGDDYIYPANDMSIVPAFCDKFAGDGWATADACEDRVHPRLGNPVEGTNLCQVCVDEQAARCLQMSWGSQCEGYCSSRCGDVCSGTCTTGNVIAALKDKSDERMGINLASILVPELLGSPEEVAAAEKNVQAVASCEGYNATEVAKGLCDNYFKVSDFEQLKASATNIADVLAKEVKSTTNENTQVVCLGNPATLSFLALLLPLLIYLALKPLQFGVRTIIHKGKGKPKAPPPPAWTAPPPVPEKEPIIFEDEEAAEVPPAGALPVEAKRFKWDTPATDKYIWASSKGMGHMPVDFATATNKSAPPSAPKDAFGAKGEKTLREAKKWEVADHYTYEKQVEEYVKEEEQLEVTIDNIYDGDDFQEAIADVLIDDILEPILSKICCGYCCCKVMCPCCEGCCADDEEEGERMTEMSGLGGEENMERGR